MHWLKDDKPRQYTYAVLMKVDNIQEYNISTTKLWELATNAGKTFEEKWKGPAYEDFRAQREYKNLILQSIVQFMRNRLTGGLSPPENFHGIAEFHVHSEAR
jgi:hypothetical protein